LSCPQRGKARGPNKEKAEEDKRKRRKRDLAQKTWLLPRGGLVSEKRQETVKSKKKSARGGQPRNVVELDRFSYLGWAEKGVWEKTRDWEDQGRGGKPVNRASPHHEVNFSLLAPRQSNWKGGRGHRKENIRGNVGFGLPQKS